MEIRINTLVLHNFKGVRSATFRFEGGNARIEGDNGTGKSTVFDAFTWLLFGKDHRGQDWTNFEIKPIDPETREPLHGLDHWVEAFLTIDGAGRTLRREFAEEWVKPRGESERVFKGHKQSFFIDGVDMSTKKAYDAAIAQWIGEDVFKLITNPLYFIDDTYTDWKTRRKGLMSLAGDAPQEGLAERFADLLAEMRGEPLEQFRKRVAYQKKANKERLAESTANIAAWRKALPEKTDTAWANSQIEKIYADRDKRVAELRRQIAEIDTGLTDINKANADRNTRVGALHKRLTEIRLSQEAYINERLAAARREYDSAEGALKDVLSKADAVSRDLSVIDTQIKAARQEARTQRAFRDNDAKDLRELGAEYDSVRERTFSCDLEDVCPACGQPIPRERLDARREEARAKFVELQKTELQSIVARAQGLKAAIAEEDALIQEKEDLANGLTVKRDGLAAKRDALMAEAESLRSTPAPDLEGAERGARREPGFLALAREEQEVNSQIIAISAENVSPDALLTDRRRLEADTQAAWDEADKQSATLRDLLAAARQRDALLEMIAGEEERERAFADEVARLERLEFRAQEYVKAEIDSAESAINSLFRDTRWRMFDTTIDGGITEMCEATSLSGVPFGSMNDAQKIICGMDVIRVFSERVGCWAPIFVDNAESVTVRDFGTRAQVIRLVVAEGRELTTVNE